MVYKLLFICLLIFCDSSRSAKILAVYPMPSISHQVVFRVLTNELIKKGHEVVVITPDPEYSDKNRPSNLTEIDVHDVSYATWKTNYVEKMKKSLSIVENIKCGIKIMITIVEDQMKTPQIKNMLEQNQHFDLVIVETSVPLALGFAHKYKAPVIQFTSFYGTSYNFMKMGAPTHPFLYPPFVRHKISDLSIKDKLLSILVDNVLKYLYAGYVDELNRSLKIHFGESTPLIDELESNVDMIFINSNPMWEVSRPVPMSIVFLGGMHIMPPKKLPNDLKLYLDSSKNGVIYVSFGTNLNPSQLSKEKIQTFLNVFSKLPYDIMWKWDKDDIEEKPQNVRLFKWAPQMDLLRHPKIKLFITQAGLQSTDEAIAAGVPLIGIPVLTDQHFNSAKYVQHKIGLKLSMDTMTEEELLNAIKTVIDDKSYKNNILHLQKLIYDQPQTPAERAVWWAEYVIRHKGAKHLHGPAGKVSWAEFLELKLLATLLLIFLSILIISIGIIYTILKCILKVTRKFYRRDRDATNKKTQ